MSSSQTHALLQPKVSDASRVSFLTLFSLILACGISYAAYQLFNDLAGVRIASSLAPLLLGVALLIALAFEFVNGFHDTANAVATVIYTNSLKPHAAVVWSGIWNFAGVMLASGTVAFGIIALLPVELILQVGSAAGFAMVFALLFAAIIWNVGTWYFGLPASSSHTLIGSVIGVGLMNQLIEHGSKTSGVDWSQAVRIGYSLLLSPVIGFTCAALLLLAARALLRNPELYRAPQGQQPPPFWPRAVLILTCTGVSFAHGSNDGQKGMGLIMLILIGTVPTAYALNLAVPPQHVQTFVTDSQSVARTLEGYAGPLVRVDSVAEPREELARYLKSREFTQATLVGLHAMIGEVSQEVSRYGAYSRMPDEMRGNVRNDMYLVSESLRLMDRSGIPHFMPPDRKMLAHYRKDLDHATKYIPGWVKVAVAMALGLGTMIGWRRIVITVGEKIGKQHLTYAQGASAETVAMSTIAAADAFGLPVSTTHVLSSGVAGTMAANRAGLQWITVRNVLTAWLLTLPMSILLAGVLYWLFRQAL
jgi:PiT family inorganic phosphate transporter